MCTLAGNSASARAWIFPSTDARSRAVGSPRSNRFKAFLVLRSLLLGAQIVIVVESKVKPRYSMVWAGVVEDLDELMTVPIARLEDRP